MNEKINQIIQGFNEAYNRINEIRAYINIFNLYEEYLQSEQPHICMYKDNVEIILTQANNETIKPNRVLYGYGYDAYIYTSNQLELQTCRRKICK